MQGVWDRLEAAGIPSLRSFTHRRHRPHISLVVADRLDAGGWQDELRASLFEGELLGLELGPAAAFPGWVYLAVAASPRLAGAHARVFATLGRSAEGVWEHCRPDKWVPHCTLAGELSPEQAEEAFRLAGSAPLPIRATVAAAMIVDAETGAEESLWTAPDPGRGW